MMLSKILPWRKPINKHESKKPIDSNWRQQRLRAWKPILTPMHVMVLYTIIALIFIPIGIAILATTSSINETDIFGYQGKCELNTTCNITITLENDFKKPIYFYYHLDWFFQNYRTYVRSRSDKQLRGDEYSRSYLYDCKPRRGDPEGTHDKNRFFLPCGLQAYALFNDTFELFNDRGKSIDWKEEDISWKSDRKHKYKNPPKDQPGIRVVPDFEDEHFIVWMKPAVFPKFRKLYAIIEEDLPKGEYIVEIDNRYSVNEFNGGKGVVLSEASWIGGKNEVLGASYIVVGGTCVILAVYFLYFKLRKSRPLGDASYLKWDR